MRQYDARPIPEDVMGRMKQALRFAPSACNYQPWKFVLVTDPDLKRGLATAARGQGFIAQAPVIVVGVGFPRRAYKGMGGHGNSVEVDLAIALDQLRIGQDIVSYGFLIVFGAAALAGALAVGLGAREVVAGYLSERFGKKGP